MRQYKVIEKLRRDVERMGATLDVDDYMICADAPDGKVWKATGSSVLAVEYADNCSTWAAEAVKEILVDIAYGLEDLV